MKLKNPNYVTPEQSFIETNKAAIQAYFAGNANLEFIDFGKVREDHPALASQLTDGTIHQICIDLGIDVSE